MINIDIICVGKLKEKSLRALSDEYLKRLQKYAKINIIELNDEKIDNVKSVNEIEKIKEIECNRIIEKINKKSYIIPLDLKGKTYTSEEFSNKLSNIATYENSNITFIIGGSLGLNNKLLSLKNESICFSTFTFPHQLIRIFLLEQLFRAFKIQNNETYHH